jgi:topoisomerase-4 subunit A
LSYLYILPAGRDLVVYAGKRHLTLKGASLEAFVGVRGRRGRKLPRGFRNVDRMEAAASPETDAPETIMDPQ